MHAFCRKVDVELWAKGYESVWVVVLAVECELLQFALQVANGDDVVSLCVQCAQVLYPLLLDEDVPSGFQVVVMR